jgi:tetratricopeptide (TPR) repeat protein
MSMETLTRAWEVLQDAYQAQMEGDYDRAVELYQSSLELHPTAEAHTFLGWTYHFQGRIEEAIVECRRAIEIDPEFGNPYNDIGAYLIELGRFEEAIPWLPRKPAATSRAIFRTTIWAARISEKKCTATRCAASRKRCKSSRAIPWRSRRSILCAAW